MTFGVPRRVSQTAAVLVLSLLVWLAIRTLDFPRLVLALSDVRTGWVALAALSYVAILPLWAWQWTIIAPPAPRNTWREMLGVVSVASAVHNSTALLGGEIAGVFLLVHRVGLSTVEAISVTAMDQLLVGIAKFGIVLVAALTNTLPGWMSNGLVGLGAGVVVLLVVCVAALARGNDASVFVRRTLSARAGDAVFSFGQALAPLRSSRRAVPAQLIAFAKKLVEIGAIVCIQYAFGVSLHVSIAFLVLAALNLATLLPVIPGNLGIYEAVVVVIYIAAGVEAEQAAAMALVQHAAYLAALALPGYLWFGTRGLPRSMAAVR